MLAYLFSRSASLHNFLLACMLAVFATGCGAGLEIRHLSVIDAHEDEKTKATRVSLTFEVWQGDQQLTDLPRSAFKIYEDGQPATSEGLNEADTNEIRVPVALVLDVSLSMYEAGAVADLKAAASQFEKQLNDSGYEVSTYRFATDIQQVSAISEIPDEFDEDSGRWTSLYAAVRQAFRDHPDGIVVVFSDGADNYSSNHGVADLAAVAVDTKPVEAGGNGNRRVVHAIAFGKASTERDKAGVPAMEALQTLAQNGSMNTAANKEAFTTIFDDVASRIRNVYLFDYFSPNLTGEHTLVLEVTANGQTVKSQPVKFQGGGSASSRWKKKMGMLDFDRPGDSAPSAQRLRKTKFASFHRTLVVCVRTDPTGAKCVELLGRVLSDATNGEVDSFLVRHPKAERYFMAACAVPHMKACHALDRVEGRGVVGITFKMEKDGARVLEVPQHGAAFAGGVRKGALIVAIDGVSLKGKSNDDVVGMMSGTPGTTVSLRLEQAGAEQRVVLTRRSVLGPRPGERRGAAERPEPSKPATPEPESTKPAAEEPEPEDSAPNP